MITPRFKLIQNDDAVIVTIHAPFSRVADSEVFMEKQDFRFSSTPYYLRLTLPGEIVENDEAKAHFNAETNEFVITCSKVVKGQYFSGLDMLTELLQPKGKRCVDGAKIGVLSEDSNTESETDFDWFVEQKLPDGEDSAAHKSCCGFGFKYSGLFETLAEELHQVLDVKNPDDRSAEDRRSERIQRESQDFDPEHYLADLFQTDLIDPLIAHETDEKVDQEWTEVEANILKNLPNKDFLLDTGELQQVYLSLVDILLAYCYDQRITMNDANVESAWTIAKLSGTLSWLEVKF